MWVTAHSCSNPQKTMSKRSEPSMIHADSVSSLIYLKETSDRRRDASNKTAIRDGAFAFIAMALLVILYIAH